MSPEFSAEAVAHEVIAHLERRRAALAGAAVAEEAVRAEVEAALEPVRRAYQDAELPEPYLRGLEAEITEVVPARWLAGARAFTTLEQRGFGLWRGGDLVARLTYVFLGLCLGGLCVEAPFIPIWEKWFPFAMAIGAWWLPSAQVAWLRRRYVRTLRDIVRTVGSAQEALERRVSTRDLLAAPRDGESDK